MTLNSQDSHRDIFKSESKKMKIKDGVGTLMKYTNKITKNGSRNGKMTY